MFNNRYAQNRGTFIVTLMGEMSLFNTQMEASVAQTSNVQDAQKYVGYAVNAIYKMYHYRFLNFLLFSQFRGNLRKLSHAI